MAVLETLTTEDEAARAGWVETRDSQIYVGDRIRIRDIVPTGLSEPVLVGGRWKMVASTRERIVVADVNRVMTSVGGKVFVMAHAVDSTVPLKMKRIRHEVGSAKMRARKHVVKEVLLDPTRGPSAEERMVETPVAHSTRVRMQAFRDLVRQAGHAGIPETMVWMGLLEHADRRARQVHGQANLDLAKAGKPALPEPDDLGDREAAVVRSTRRGDTEPDWWMFPVLNSALSDPSAFIAEFTDETEYA